MAHEIHNPQTALADSNRKLPCNADFDLPLAAFSDSDFDLAVRAQWARLTLGLSPAAVVAAGLDWMTHLAISPHKQSALWAHALHSATHWGDVCLPDPRDRRFVASPWSQWPYNWMAPAFVRMEQWWQDATTDVPGTTRQHEQLMAFLVRQILDAMSPSNFPLTNPEVLARTVETGGWNWVQGANHFWLDAVQGLSSQGAADVAFEPGKDVALTPGKVVWRNDLMELIQYTPQTSTVRAEPLLIVPPWIMKYYILDLSPHNSLVRHLVSQGYTVFMISWVNPDARAREVGMDDYLKRGVMAALDAVTLIVPGRKVQAVGYCLGGTLMAIAAAYMARQEDARLKSLTLFAAEVDFTEPGELGLFINESQLALLDGVMWEQGFLNGQQMAGAFTLLNARAFWAQRVSRYLLGRDLPQTDLGAWNADATRMPYRQHSRYLSALYRDNDLAQGRYEVDGLPVALPDIQVPVFALGMQRDNVAPWRSVFKLHLLMRTEMTFCLSTGGHNVGVVNPPGPGVPRSYQLARQKLSDRYKDPETWAKSVAVEQGSWWPAWVQWLAQHSDAQAAPPSLGAPGHPVLDDAPGRYVMMP